MRFRSLPISITALAALALSTLTSSAEFTYVDATLSNSTLDGQAFTLVPPANYDVDSPSGGDELWSLRELSGFEGGGFFESDSGRPPLAGGQNDYESLPDIITSITLPSAGTYRIVAIFATNSNRDIAAKVGASPTSADIFTRDNRLDVDQSAPAPDIVFDSSYNNGRGSTAGGADLGTVTTTTDNETIQIHINGLASTTDLDADGRHDDERTRYDGIAYELVAPTAPAHRDVFIIAGQSNADGRGLTAELAGALAPYAAPQPDVLIYFSNPAYGDANPGDPLYKTWTTLRPGFSAAPPAASSEPLPRATFGVEVAAATVLSQTYAKPAFIKVTEGGTRLGREGEDWHPPTPDPAKVGRLYTELVTSVQSALAELTANGDTYTLHGVYWHQGESDSSRTTTYSGLLQTFATSLREDLGKPNLRFIVGELDHNRDPDGNFRAAQWDASRQLRNASFLSAINLATTDGTHFDTASNIEFGLRLGELFIGQNDTITFESPAYGAGELDRQNDFESDAGITIATTTASGDYTAGQAITNPAAPLTAFRENVLPLAQARALQADFFPAATDSTLLVAGWQADSDADGLFDPDESGLGLGLGTDGLFHLRVGNAVIQSTGFAYQNDTWYRLTASWTAPDATGASQISLFARDLTNAQDLNGGAAIATSTAALTPAIWLGTGIQIDRGTIDSIGVEPPGYTGWQQNRHPTLDGGTQGDPDHDGIPNAFEYALGLDPTRADLDSFDFTFDQLAGEVTLSLPEIARAEDTIIALETSTDLGQWLLTEGERTAMSRDFTFPTSTPRRFFRPWIEIGE